MSGVAVVIVLYSFVSPLLRNVPEKHPQNLDTENQGLNPQKVESSSIWPLTNMQIVFMRTCAVDPRPNVNINILYKSEKVSF